MKNHFLIKFDDWKNTSSYRFLIDNVNFLESPARFLEGASFWDRRILAKLVQKCYSFEDTTGAWHKIDKRVRFCEFCLKMNVFSRGDEVHYLVSCPRFDSLRSKLHIVASEIVPTLFSKYLGKPTTQFQYHVLAKFVRQSFDLLPDPYRRDLSQSIYRLLYPFEPVPAKKWIIMSCQLLIV